MPVFKIIRAGDPLELWDGEVCYYKGARCLHKDREWECTIPVIHNTAFEPGGFAPYGWEVVTQTN